MASENFTQGLSYKYRRLSKGYEVTGPGSVSDTEIIIPDTYEGRPVTSIANNAFYNCDTIEKVLLPSSLTSIGKWAFKGCTSLKSINLPEGLEEIGKYAFYGCESLEEITIPESLVSISKDVFNGCISLKSVTIPSGMKHIMEDAFQDCNSLESVYYESTASKWAAITFDGRSSQPLQSGAYLYLKGEKADDIILEDVSVSPYAFSGCGSLKAVSFSGGVPSIGNEAFSGCVSLESVAVTSDVMHIGRKAFAGCESFEAAFFEAPFGWYASTDPKGEKNGDDLDLRDELQNARYLTSMYCLYHWFRNSDSGSGTVEYYHFE